MNGTLEYFEETLKMFNSTLTRIDELAPRLTAVVDRMEGSSGASNASWASARR